MLRAFFLFVLVAFAVPDRSTAQDATRVAAIEQAWSGWLDKYAGGRGTLAISYRGKLVHEAGRGVAANSAQPVASLSKAITGACVVALAREGKLDLNARLASIAGLDVPAGAANIRIHELLSQTSGLRPDSTQKSMGMWLNRPTPYRHAEVTATALARTPQSKGRYFYNNENYAVLGRVIELVVGGDYAKACARRVGLRGAMSPRYGAFGAWGGWVVSAADYLRFAAKSLGADSTIGRNPRALGAASLGGGAYYGPGVLFRQSGSGYNFWHAGKHCFGSGGSAGAFFASWGGLWSVAVTFPSCPSDSAMKALDNALWRAANG